MFKQYINGTCVDGNGKPFDVVNPATEEVIATGKAADRAQSIMAVKAAQTAFKSWSRTSINERVGWIVKLRQAFQTERDKKVTEELVFGEVHVNNPGSGTFVPLPHVGIKESGVGCDGSYWALEEYFWMRRFSIRP